MTQEVQEWTYLKDVLFTSVGEWIAFAMSRPASEIRQRARMLEVAVLAMGDTVAYDDPEVLNTLAQAIALCALDEGGVWYLDRHFRAEHPGT